MKITITSPKTILVAFMRATLLGEFCLHQASQARWLWTKWSNPSLAEKPKVGELQMDWLRSEDLKEEKSVTASTTIIAAPPLWRRQEAGRPSMGTLADYIYTIPPPMLLIVRRPPGFSSETNRAGRWTYKSLKLSWSWALTIFSSHHPLLPRLVAAFRCGTGSESPAVLRLARKSAL